MFRVPILLPALAASWLLPCPEARAQPTPAALNTELQTAQPGAIVTLGYTIAGTTPINNAPNQFQLLPGNLVYSDDPEETSGSGILYRTLVGAGPTRVYTYHVNGPVETAPPPAKVTVVLENAGSAPASVSFQRKSLPNPSANYIAVGREAVRQFYENTSLPAPLTIAPGEGALLDPALDTKTVLANQLLHSIHDLTSDQPLTVTVLMLSPAADTLTSFRSVPFLANDGSNRQGSALSNGKTSPPGLYSYNTTANIRRLRIADTVSDPNVPSTDAEGGPATSIRGNFGVTYSIRVNLTSGDGRNVAVLMNPRGGGYGGYFRTSFPGPARPIGGGQMAPASQLNLNDNTKGVVVGKFTPSGTPQTLQIDFIPAGASSLPIELHLVPYTGATVPVALSGVEIGG